MVAGYLPELKDSALRTVSKDADNSEQNLTKHNIDKTDNLQ